MRRLVATRARLSALAVTLLLGGAGCAALEEQERRWIFQPGRDSWGGGWQARGLDEVWIDIDPAGGDDRGSGPERLHALWLPQPRADAPVMLYLHGARWDVRSSAGRMRRMHDAGFAVLGIDYRGFGQSSERLPSERSVHDDALAAWRWLAQRAPGAVRYVYGHSLGSAIAVGLAAALHDGPDRPAGLVLEGAFTSIPDLIAGWRYGWLPVGPLVTQRFDAASQLSRLHLPLVVVHGSADRLIPAALGRALFDRAPGPKRFVLVDGGTHHNAGALGADAVRQALGELRMGPSAAARAGAGSL